MQNLKFISQFDLSYSEFCEKNVYKWEKNMP